MNKLTVGIVCGEDEQVLNIYDIETEPAARFSQAMRTLRHPLLSETDGEACHTATECMMRYIEESLKRAADVEYRLSSEDEKISQLSLYNNN